MPIKAHHIVAVLVTSSSDRYSPRDKLAALVFELHNSKMPHTELTRKIVDQDISREDFVLSGAKLEHQALTDTKRFLKSTSFSASSEKRYSYARFILEVEEDFDKYLGKYRRSNGELIQSNPLEYWEKYYDSVRK